MCPSHERISCSSPKAQMERKILEEAEDKLVPTLCKFQYCLHHLDWSSRSKTAQFLLLTPTRLNVLHLCRTCWRRWWIDLSTNSYMKRNKNLVRLSTYPKKVFSGIGSLWFLFGSDAPVAIFLLTTCYLCRCWKHDQMPDYYWVVTQSMVWYSLIG